MNYIEKRDFIDDLIEQVKEEIMEASPKFPENWNGYEIRQFIADKFADANHCKMSLSRKRAYNNTILIENL